LGKWLGLITILLRLRFTIQFQKIAITKIKMEKDNLLGAKVRIRRGWHGGRIGKVTVFDRHNGQVSSHVEIKVQLDGSGQVINIPSEEELEKITEVLGGSALQ
jgi:hypothetical protein